MPNVVDLALTSEARRTLHRVLDERGLSFFLKEGKGGGARIGSRRIAWVVEVARRAVRKEVRDPNALSGTRRILRRELIRRLAERMVRAGY